MVDIKKRLYEYEQVVSRTKERLEKDRNKLMANINYYSSDEIVQLNSFFESIDLIFEEEFNDFKGKGEFIKCLKIDKYINSLKEINNTLEMFENNLAEKTKENIKK